MSDISEYVYRMGQEGCTDEEILDFARKTYTDEYIIKIEEYLKETSHAK